MLSQDTAQTLDSVPCQHIGIERTRNPAILSNFIKCQNLYFLPTLRGTMDRKRQFWRDSGREETQKQVTTKMEGHLRCLRNGDWG